MQTFNLNIELRREGMYTLSIKGIYLLRDIWFMKNKVKRASHLDSSYTSNLTSGPLIFKLFFFLDKLAYSQALLRNL